MRPAEHRRMYETEDRHWWFVGRRRLLRALLEDLHRDPAQTRILDIGCGTGANLPLIGRYGRLLASDSFPAAIDFCRRRGLRDLCRADAARLPLGGGMVDIVTAFEVLEHLEDDAAPLGEIHRVLRPGGVLILTVPAHPFLWSDHDVALDHRRRYTRRRLLDRLGAAGFEVERLTYCFTLLFLPAAGARLWERLRRRAGLKAGAPRTDVRETPGWIARILVGLLSIEASLVRRFDLPIGLTLACVARRA